MQGLAEFMLSIPSFYVSLYKNILSFIIKVHVVLTYRNCEIEMKGRIIYAVVYLLIALSSCSKDDHEVRPVPEDSEAVITVCLNTDDVMGVSLSNIHLFCFDQTDLLTGHYYYSSMQEFGGARIVLPVGNYTILAVLNVGTEFMPFASRNGLPDMDLVSVAEWIKTQADTYPDMLTGTLRHVATNGEERVYINLAPKDEGVNLTNVELLLTLPSSHLPDYSLVRSVSASALRGVAEICKRGTSERIAIQRAMLTKTGDKNIYRFDLSLWKGEYDISLWVDYTADDATDNHYITTTLNPIEILPPESYIANTDTRDAFAGRLALNMTEGRATCSVTLSRPLAKYRLVATDVLEYNELRKEKGWPLLDDLTVKITYDGFWPSAYSVTNAAPAGAKGGYGYVSALSEQSLTEASIGKDYVFVNGTESFVKLTISFYNSDGVIINQVRNLQVSFRIGYLTTVQGNFLTTGSGNGIHIDTEWSGEYEVIF